MNTSKSQAALDYLIKLIGKIPTLGDYLLAIRQGEEMSQVDFAKLLGVSRQYLCDIEHNRRFISPKMATEFAHKLGYSKNQFVRLCLQDLLNREGVGLSVSVENVA